MEIPGRSAVARATGEGSSVYRLKGLLLVALASIALVVSARVSIPFYPVPLTMQSFVVLALGICLGPRLAASAVLLYLAQGAMGLPVFAGSPERGIGLAYLAGPTGGFLLGFVFAAAVCGWLMHRGWSRNIVWAFAAAFVGALAYYLPGLLWLGTVIGWDKPVLSLGLWPFVYGELLKLCLLAVAAPALVRTPAFLR